MVEDHPAQVSGQRGGREELGELELGQPLPLDAPAINLLVLHILCRPHVQQRFPPQLLGPCPLLVQLFLKSASKLGGGMLSEPDGGLGWPPYLLSGGQEISQISGLHSSIGVSQDAE